MTDRMTHRQGPAVVRHGVPYADSTTTLSLLTAAAVGEWLATHRHVFHGDLLDLGCGNQPYRSWYEPLVATVTAVDAAPLPGVDVVGHATRIPLRDQTFDVILATEVLEHVENAEAAMSEIHRLLKPGGHVVATVPYLYPTHEAPHDHRRFTHHGLISIAERHGLDVVDVAAKGGVVTLLCHYAIMCAVELVRFITKSLGSPRHPSELRLVRLLLGTPQEVVIKRRRIWRPIRGITARASLGYMLVARKESRAGR